MDKNKLFLTIIPFLITSCQTKEVKFISDWPSSISSNDRKYLYIPTDFDEKGHEISFQVQGNYCYISISSFGNRNLNLEDLKLITVNGIERDCSSSNNNKLESGDSVSFFFNKADWDDFKEKILNKKDNYLSPDFMVLESYGWRFSKTIFTV